ncbi:MAG: FAD-binding oxidoreductase [Chloroflexi bacterium]|nr:FAD-binding oxidoreductase [Chloroflexota bacterium]
MNPTATHQRLESTFGGELIRPGDPAYDTARGVWNGMIDKHPALIARCRSAEDVRAALAHAREHDLEVAVRGGGHSPPGFSTSEGGLVIDVGPMKTVEIDPESRTGRFGAGLNWGELDAATQEHGLAVTGGRVTHTGIAGLTLGSGSGWLERKHGMTGASLLSAEVVTADGRIVRASVEENPELLWGLRGGGGNFGVVTEFEFRLHPVGPMLFAGQILHPREAAPELLRFYRDFIAQAPDEVGGGFALLTAPPADFVPEEARGKPACGLILVYAGDPAEGEQALRPLLDWGQPLLSRVGPMPYTAVQAMTDQSHPWGIRHYAKVDFIRELNDEAVEVIVAEADRMRSPFSQLLLQPLGGAVARMDKGAMALNMPDAEWACFVFASWWEPRGEEEHIAWARGVMEALRPWSADTVPPNFIQDEGAERLRRFYGDEKYGRLVALKDTYDPRNVFALNQNIPPSALRVNPYGAR